jgi:succinate-semialdehyde dehydrogenase / glutarate-semialdehyde dehydrogenase
MNRTMLNFQDSSLLRRHCYIDGRWIGSGRHIEFTNPVNGERVGKVSQLGAREKSKAVESNNRALATWRARTAKERSAVLRKWFELLLAHQEDLARAMTAEQGKPIAEARGEIACAASFIEWFAEEGKCVYSETVPAPLSKQSIFVAKEPVGVCRAIVPWNFPAAMITRNAAPALAAGCTLVLNPTAQTSLTAFALVALAERAGIPAGVLSIVTGSARVIGGELSTNALVRKLTFTGSTEVGRVPMAQTASTVKKVSMEFGGNAPFIVFDEADLDAAVEGDIVSRYRKAGQACVCAHAAQRKLRALPR